jgi:hypothetical protein
LRSVKSTTPDPLLEELRERVEHVVGRGRVTYKALAEAARVSEQTLKALRERRFTTLRSGTSQRLQVALDLIEGGVEGLPPHLAAIVADAKLEVSQVLARMAGRIAAAAVAPPIPDQQGKELAEAIASQDGQLSASDVADRAAILTVTAPATNAGAARPRRKAVK